MKVKNIERQLASFKAWLSEQESYPELYKYENLANFRAHWDIEATDFYEMFDAAFKSQISNSLWGGSVNSAKSVMLTFIKNNKTYVRSMFRDLYNEDKDLGLRINRFSLHCDEMMDQLPDNKLKPVEHKHNPRILSVYLAFHDPSQYTIIDYHAFRRMLERLENNAIPQEFEMERLFKLARALYKMMVRDAELITLHKKLVGEEWHRDADMLIVHDFIMLHKQYKTY